MFPILINQSLIEKDKILSGSLEKTGIFSDKTAQRNVRVLSNFNFGELQDNPNNYIDALTEYYYNFLFSSANINTINYYDLAFIMCRRFKRRINKLMLLEEDFNTEAINMVIDGKDNEYLYSLADQSSISTCKNFYRMKP